MYFIMQNSDVASKRPLIYFKIFLNVSKTSLCSLWWTWKRPFYNNCPISCMLIGWFVSSIRGQMNKIWKLGLARCFSANELLVTNWQFPAARGSTTTLANLSSIGGQMHKKFYVNRCLYEMKQCHWLLSIATGHCRWNIKVWIEIRRWH